MTTDTDGKQNGRWQADGTAYQCHLAHLRFIVVYIGLLLIWLYCSMLFIILAYCSHIGIPH